jgi:amidase
VLVGTIVPGDARIVTLLREAGAVLLGKANLSEFASMRASYYAEGCYSSRGQNRSPYNLAHHPGGSSSGNASSLASNMCAFSIGTETDGSIMFAADRNAVVGLKPTVGLMSTVGVIPESPSMDTVGSFSRSVEDAKIVLDIIHERRTITDAHVNRLASTPVHNFYPGPYTSWLSKKNVLKGARFGIPWKRVWERASQNVAKRLEYNSLMELIEKIEKAGALVVKVNFPSAEEIISTGGWDREFGDGKTGSRLSEFEVVRTKFYRSHTA